MIINHRTLKEIDRSNIVCFKQHKVQVSSQETLGKLKIRLLKMVNTLFNNSETTSYMFYNNYKEDLIRIWKLDPEYELSEAFDYVQKICQKTPNYDYRIDMKGLLIL